MAALAPMTAKEIGLMLRSGYSLAAVEQDLAARHFIEAIDPAAEKALTTAGATPDLIAKLKSGAYAIPTSEIAAVQHEVEEKKRRRALQEEESKKQNTLYQDQLMQSRATATKTVYRNVTADQVKDDLVMLQNNGLGAFDGKVLEKKKLIALYFSAHWCGPCRKFTPELVEFYKRVAPAHPEFDIIFISKDRSAAAMETYMREAQMPWPAIAFSKIAEKEGLAKYAGNGIPCLVLLDAEGKVISHSYDGTTFLGPQHVLEDLGKIFANPPAAVAQNR